MNKDDTFFKGIVNSSEINFQKVPEHLNGGNTNGGSSNTNPEMIYADFYKSIVCLSTQIDSIKSKITVMESEMREIKENVKTIREKSENNKNSIMGELEHTGNHIVALEANLRTLRHTLTWGELSEDDLPCMEQCHLGGGNINIQNKDKY